MKGIRFVIDEKGRKVAVQIDLALHGELWEDICDQLVAESRADDDRIPFATVKRRISRRKQP